ncbi:hypothetical protein JCM5353_008673 [Sporobolomyces roseus]
MSRPSSRASSPLPLQSTSMTPDSSTSEGGATTSSSPPPPPPQLGPSLTAETPSYHQSQPPPTSSAYYPPWGSRQQQPLDPIYQNAPILSEYLDQSFVPSVVPQPEEYQEKEKARQFLEGLAKQVCGNNVKLLPFGSMANGFALKASDMDLCCFLDKDAPSRAPSELVELLGGLIERETNFYVKMLPRARIPIIKLTMPSTPTIPDGMACDIGFENRLALENTRLLLTYAMVDARLRNLVLFLKVWTKRRKINNPYRGTLSSYGYVLLVIHFLSHVKQPAVVPNLQRLPIPSTTPLENLTYEGHDIGFFDDIDLLPSVWQAQNTESTGELLIDFFRYFANTFDYTKSVISIRSEKGTLGKEEKGWNSDIEFDPEMIVRDLHKLCIEDPFALDYNVARTVTKDGLYTIRGEFMRAVRILTTPLPRNTQSPDRVTAIMNDLCAEREDFLLMHPPPDQHKQSPHLQHSQHSSHPHSLPHSHTTHSHSHSQLPSHQTLQNSSHQLQPQPPVVSVSSSQGPKSPRRRSAPSPQLRPAPPQQPPHSVAAIHPHHPSPNQQQQQQQQYSPHLPIQGGGQWQGQQANGIGSAATGPGVSSVGGGGGIGEELGHLHQHQENGSVGGVEGLHRMPVSTLHQPQLRRHLQPPTYPRSTPTLQPFYHSPAPSVTTTPNTTTGPSSVASSSAGESQHDRRQSWDGSQERYPPAATTTTNGNSGGGGGPEKRPIASNTTVSASSSSYDLHRFFQNPGSSSMSDAGGGSSAPSPHLHPRSTVSLTAPPSPDLTPTYYAYGVGGHNSSQYVGRAPYRYASSNYPSSSSNSIPRHATSVPRNPHTSHHAYTNPYAPAPLPAYPLNSSTGTISGTSTPPIQSQSHSQQSPYPPYPLSSVPSSPVPAPIFPAEHREQIALENSITFGNFPELLPLPSYAHYHASGGSAAYLSGSGGWGVNPYGMSSGSQGGKLARRTTGGGGAGGVYDASSPRPRGVRRSFGLSGEEDDEVTEEDEEGEDEDEDGFELDGGDYDSSSLSAARGRTNLVVNGGGGPHPTPLEHLTHVMMAAPVDRISRVRGRSVPHTRMGPDGRESILFGAIEVTLPRPEDVEAAEREEEEQQQQQQEEEKRLETAGNEVDEAKEFEEEPRIARETEEESEIANLGPSPPTETISEAPTTDDITPKALESILVPTFTTSPPTPAKPLVERYAWRPLSPLFNSTPSAAPSSSDVDDLDLDRTPRPASPTPLPNGLPPNSPPRVPLSASSDSSDISTPSSSPSIDDSPRNLTNGLSLLSMDSPRSKHAAKRARQNERKKASANQSTTALSTTSMSMV